MSETERGPDVLYKSKCMVCGVYVKDKLTTAETAPPNGELADSLCVRCNKQWKEASLERIRQKQK